MMRRVFYIAVAAIPVLACVYFSDVNKWWLFAAYLSGAWAAVINELEHERRKRK
jgi:hypothetical protein